MSQKTIDRQEYLKKYRLENKERQRELNRRNYLKRKEAMAADDHRPNNELLDLLSIRKSRKIAMMSPLRRERRERIQRQIHRELLNEMS